MNVSYLIHLSACFSHNDGTVFDDDSRSMAQHAHKIYTRILKSLSIRDDGLDNIYPQTAKNSDVDSIGLFALLFTVVPIDEFFLYVFFARMYTAHSHRERFSGSIHIINTFLDDYKAYHHSFVDKFYFYRVVGFVAGMATWNIPGMALPESSVFQDLIKPRLGEMFESGKMPTKPKKRIEISDHSDHPFSTYMNGPNIELGYGTLIGPLRVFLTFTFLPYTKNGTRIMDAARVTVDSGEKILSGLQFTDVENSLLFAFLPVYLLVIHDFTVAVFSSIVRGRGVEEATVDSLYDSLSAVLVSFFAFVTKEHTPSVHLLPFQSAVSILQGTASVTSIAAFCTLTTMQVYTNAKTILSSLNLDALTRNIGEAENELLASRLHALSLSFVTSKQDYDVFATQQAFATIMHRFSTVANASSDYSYKPGSSVDFSAIIADLTKTRDQYDTALKSAMKRNSTFVENLTDTVFTTLRLQALIDPLQVIKESSENLKSPYKYYVPLLALSSIRNWKGMSESMRTSSLSDQNVRCREFISNINVRTSLARAINTFLQRSCGQEGTLKAGDVLFVMIAMGLFRRIKITMMDEGSERMSQKRVIEMILGEREYEGASSEARKMLASAFKDSKQVVYGFGDYLGLDDGYFAMYDNIAEHARRLVFGLLSDISSPMTHSFFIPDQTSSSSSSSSS